MKHNLEINLEIQFTTPFHSGTGLPAGLIDRGIRRNYQGVLYIPATTFKGVVRNKVEDLIKIIYSYRESKAFYLSPNDSVNTDFMVCYFENPLPVENLFGSNVRQGQLFFSHLEMVKEDKEFFSLPEYSRTYDQILQAERRTRTRIYRSVKTVAASALFQSEYGIKNLRFQGSISGYIKGNLLSREKGKPGISRELFFLLGGLKLTDRLAGNKSIGMGIFEYNKLEATVDNEKIDINNYVFSDQNFKNVSVSQGK